MEERRFATPTGEPCPRCVRADGTLEGDAGCGSCGCCLLLLEAAWPSLVKCAPWDSNPEPAD